MLWATCGYFIEKSYLMIYAQKEIDFFMITINKKIYVRLIMSYCTLG